MRVLVSIYLYDSMILPPNESDLMPIEGTSQSTSTSGRKDPAQKLFWLKVFPSVAANLLSARGERRFGCLSRSAAHAVACEYKWDVLALTGIMKSQARTDSLSKRLGQWAVQMVLDARSLLRETQTTNASASAYNEVSARLACVLEELPDLWPELGEELMQSIWLGSDASIQSHLAEGAAGSLLAENTKPGNLAELLCLVGRALAEERRYCAAFKLLKKAHHIASTVGSRDLALSALVDLRSQAVPSWHFHMLNDGPRNCAFAAAIQEALRKLNTDMSDTQQEQGLTCLDIGTGTGLLALVCQQLGREICEPLRPLNIHACEENELLFTLASDIINGGSHWETLGLQPGGLPSHLLQTNDLSSAMQRYWSCVCHHLPRLCTLQPSYRWQGQVVLKFVELRERLPHLHLHNKTPALGQARIHFTNSQRLQVPPVDLVFCEASHGCF